MIRFALAALALACIVSPALAAVAAPADTVVSFPVGAWLVAFIEPLKELLVAVILFLLTVVIAKMHPIARMLLSEALVETTIRKYVDFAIASVAGATKGVALNVDIGSKVVATGVNRALNRADASKVSRWVLDEAGGPTELANKIVRTLPFEHGVSGLEVVSKALERVPVGISPRMTGAN